MPCAVCMIVYGCVLPSRTQSKYTVFQSLGRWVRLTHATDVSGQWKPQSGASRRTRTFFLVFTFFSRVFLDFASLHRHIIVPAGPRTPPAPPGGAARRASGSAYVPSCGHGCHDHAAGPRTHVQQSRYPRWAGRLTVTLSLPRTTRTREREVSHGHAQLRLTLLGLRCLTQHSLTQHTRSRATLRMP
jgi:hypothetical protein